MSEKQWRVPRLNMAFELGLAIGIAESSQAGQPHDVIIFEKSEHRLLKTLSDIRERDPGVHHGTAEGVVMAVLDRVQRTPLQTNPKLARRVLEELRLEYRRTRRQYGSGAIFKSAGFNYIKYKAFAIREDLVKGRGSAR